MVLAYIFLITIFMVTFYLIFNGISINEGPNIINEFLMEIVRFILINGATYFWKGLACLFLFSLLFLGITSILIHTSIYDSLTDLIEHIVKENRDKRFSSYYATNLKYKISNKRKVEKLKQKQIEKQNLDNWFLNIEIKYNNIKRINNE